ncbi:iron chelate uptake ABC transporter family permease subunit [Breoghania sp.]|uniref:iron chelate uptake ABC transporter family permease subunit n=1 Tax=Breoghania sp. TaxID=2065378 RepID=UPI00260C5FA5|nr:iron chelate uptake ABC transporter family permease subunit [Breoghania sp.]MDJ0930600.1 iron chelate uptake ABC transporter family permease subunit [Breoghania sp.]
MATLALWLACLPLATTLPPAAWPGATLSPSPNDMAALLFHYSFLPRSVVALAAGAVLGLAGAILQQVLQNPLVSPATLGVSAGAQLALALALLLAPDPSCPPG